jgi:hypothetical protein
LAIGQQDGAAFAEITKEGKLSYLGRLPQYSTPSTWREIRGKSVERKSFLHPLTGQDKTTS